MAQSSRALIVGISGVSCSGKTTLSRLLRGVWPRTSILHEDDFYWPDEQIPMRNGVQDWDCLEAIDIKKFKAALLHIKTHGTIPEDLDSKEDQNSVGEIQADSDVLKMEQQRVLNVIGGNQSPPIVIVDGFLLFSAEMQDIWELVDLRLFLRTSYATAKARREKRTGYVTIEGFWEDPPGYVDEIVWPNYVKDHAFLFVEGNVEGKLDAEACKAMKIKAAPHSSQVDMTQCLLWASRVVEEGYKFFIEISNP